MSETKELDLVDVPREVKRAFFHRLAHRMRTEMRMLMQGGWLRVDREDKRWKGGRGTVEHCIAQVPVMRELTKLCGLSDEDTEELCMHSAVHDWDKQFELVKQEIAVSTLPLREKLQEEELIEASVRCIWHKYVPYKLPLDEKLIAATSPAFHERFPNSTFEERLMFYVDDMFDGSNPVKPMERIDDAERRHQNLGPDYWPNERAMIVRTQSEIFERMKRHAEKTGTTLPIGNPDQIPQFLRSRVAQTMMDSYGNVDHLVSQWPRQMRDADAEPIA